MSTFGQYKQVLESQLINDSYFYSGEVIESQPLIIRSSEGYTDFSKNLIDELIWKIDNWSFLEMKKKSVDIKIEKNKLLRIEEIITQIPIDCKFIFFSTNFVQEVLKNYLNSLKILEQDVSKNYLGEQFKFNFFGSEITGYLSKYIEDDPLEMTVYFTDSPIQSFVWISQNIEYSINFTKQQHVVKCPVYHCDYKAYRVTISDTPALRGNKLTKILK
ncbi:MAG: hypothetical protein EBU90_11900 [Proteobacteria bacterium]|nr:hypothetical protein [Pseudomonadota bacterium]NBP15365.1 hypothetical protein [bacterium]